MELQEELRGLDAYPLAGPAFAVVADDLPVAVLPAAVRVEPGAPELTLRHLAH